MSVVLSPLGGAGAQFLDSNGFILSGGLLYTYAAGTTTPLAAYTTSTGGTPHTNPIVLDSTGQVPGGEIWLSGVAYKFVLTAADATAVGTWDNVGSGAATTLITDDTTTNNTVYPTWSVAASGGQSQKTSSTKLSFNPSTGLLTATGFFGPLTGNVTGNVTGTLVGTPALPTGTTAVTQATSDNSTKLATTAYVRASSVSKPTAQAQIVYWPIVSGANTSFLSDLVDLGSTVGSRFLVTVQFTASLTAAGLVVLKYQTAIDSAFTIPVTTTTASTYGAGSGNVTVTSTFIVTTSASIEYLRVQATIVGANSTIDATYPAIAVVPIMV